MFKVFSEFQSPELADHAAWMLHDRVSGLTRIVTRSYNWSITDGLSSAVSAQPEGAEWLFTPNELFSGGTFLPAAGSDDVKTEPMEREECMLCAEGPRETVEEASHILRSMGGLRVMVTDAPGRFF